jgi:hypothetical protein
MFEGSSEVLTLCFTGVIGNHLVLINKKMQYKHSN